MPKERNNPSNFINNQSDKGAQEKKIQKIILNIEKCKMNNREFKIALLKKFNKM